MEYKPPSPYWDNPIPKQEYLDSFTPEQLEELKRVEIEYRKKLVHISQEPELFDLATTKRNLYDELLDRFSKVICDNEDARVFALLCQYFSADPQFERTEMSNGRNGVLSKGIYLTGTVGIGKTEVLMHFSKTLPFKHGYYYNNGYEIFVTAAQMASEYSQTGDLALSKYINSKTLLIDDIGREPQGVHYGGKLEVVEHVLAGRYHLSKRERVVTHVSTNIVDAELIEERYGNHIRSRFKEMFNKIYWNGKEKR